MSGPVEVRKLATLILTLWVFSACVTALHAHHHCDCEEHDDGAPCSICIAVQQVPLISLARAETFEAERDVVAWIAPWIAIVPEEVFFDRPLARGPPALS